MIGYEEITSPVTVDGGDGLLAIIVYQHYRGETGSAKFFTDPSQSQQLAYMRYPSGHSIPAHIHLENRRWVPRTQEVLLVRSGLAHVTFYQTTGEQVCVKTLAQGDLVLLMAGGHRIDFLQDTEIIEVKTGPYYGRDKDKVLLEGK